MLNDIGMWGTAIAGLFLLGIGVVKNSKSMMYFGVVLTICASIIFVLPGFSGIAAKIALLIAATVVYVVSKRKDD